MGIFSKKDKRSELEIELEKTMREEANAQKEAWKRVVLTTTDFLPNKKIVKIIGLAREQAYDALRKEAIRMKGNAVIGIRPANDSAGVYKMLGTVVLVEDI